MQIKITISTLNDYYPKDKKITNAREVAEKRKMVLVGMRISITIMVNSMEMPPKLEIDLPYALAISLLGIWPKEMKSAYETDTT